MSDADCTPGREPRSVAASEIVILTIFVYVNRCAAVCQFYEHL